MASTKATRPATAETANGPQNDLPGGAIPFANSTWRQRFKVHPAADAFPMMSDAELDELGKDIKARKKLPASADVATVILSANGS